MIATAPGKILIAGEYAVLEGHPAVVMAVGVRARAEMTGEPPALSDFLAAAAAVIAEACGPDSEAANRASRVQVDTGQFAHHGRKLGLGSSAAAVVAAIACALFSNKGRILSAPDSITGCPTHMRAGVFCGVPDCDQVFALARRAHARAQKQRGAAGSGADIAAATYGGALLYQQAPPAQTSSPTRSPTSNPSPIPTPTPSPDQPAVTPWPIPAGVSFVPVWTQKPASTAHLVAQVQRARDANPAPVNGALDQIARAARTLIEAETTAAVIEALTAGDRALAQLAHATGAPLLIPAHDAIAKLARDLGGTAKPTGAGGGDIALAALPDPDAADKFRALASAAGFVPLAAGMDPRGVALTSCGSRAPGA